jgi:mannosylglucosylglycerate synthase
MPEKNESRPRRNVTLLHYTAPPSGGGINRVVEWQARGLADAGFDVQIIAENACDLPGVVSHALPLVGVADRHVEEVNVAAARGIVGEAFHRLAGRITELLVSHLREGETVIAHNALTHHRNLALTTALHNARERGALPDLVAWCHDASALDPRYEAELHSGHPWSLLRTAWPGVTYATVSATRRRELAELFGVPPEDIAVVPPGVDAAKLLDLSGRTMELVEKYRLLDGNPLLLYPTRISRRKNLDRAIDVAAGLLDLGLAPRLLITGQPGGHVWSAQEYERHIRERAARVGHDAVVVLHPEHDAHAIDAETLADLYLLADGVLLTTTGEGFGLSALEAALTRAPVFCTDIPPFREILGDNAALYFTPTDPPARIAGRIAHYFTTNAHLGPHRRHLLRTHDWHHTVRTGLLPLLPRPEAEGASG